MDRVPDYRDVCPDEQGPEDEDPAVLTGVEGSLRHSGSH